MAILGNMVQKLSERFHSKKSPYTLFSNRDILKLVVPLFLEQLLFSFVGTADTLMVAVLGEASISAVSLSDMFNIFISSIFFALATGGAVVVSQFIGAGNMVRARESAKQLLVVVLFVGIASAVFFEIFLSPMIRLLYGELAPDVHDATLKYFRITLAGLPFIAVYGGCAALFRSMNRTKTTMYISLTSNVVNILGNAILIFLCGLGVAGAAYATLLARFVSMAVILVLITDKSHAIFVDFYSGYRVSWQLVKKILYIGIPGGIENGVFQFGRLVVLGLIASYGTREIAANAIANNIDANGCIVGGAFSLAVITVIGQAVGAGNREQIRFYVWKMMKWACVAHFCWNVLLFAVTPLLLMCFSEVDTETRALAWILILIHNGIGMFVWPLSFVFPHVLRSMNDVRWPMVISVASMILVRIGTSYAIAP